MKITRDFTLALNGQEMPCEITQSSHGAQVYTHLTIGKHVVEDSSGSKDCWLDLHTRTEAYLQDYAIQALLRDWEALKQFAQD